ncbi:LOW QUALITY PROTEIN: trimeric intracellular cation channel type 1B.1-like, partial [Homarus americanus]|uniref:LOW QUALITY PROTEIN: trimeric intracellular cation channel type 1B.1-like n=1 Tax=Homarus americanus TaxID=6706 RepID=UPI001C436F45
MANQVTVEDVPYFDIAHCTCCLYVRDDLGTGEYNDLPFSRKHPLANWLSSMLAISASGFLTNFLLGGPILGALKNNQLLLALQLWYVIFYSPFDIGYKIAKFLPIKVLLAAMKEVYRVKKINDGVTHAAKVFPNGYLSMILIGTIKGNGSGFLKILERLMRGVWTPAAVEVMQPTFPTKASIAAALIFVLDKKTDLISAPHALVYFGICIFFVYFKVRSLSLGIHDPFLPFETCLYIPIWDSLAQTLADRGGCWG